MKKTDGYYPPHEYRGLMRSATDTLQLAYEFLWGKKDENGRTIVKPFYHIKEGEELLAVVDNMIAELKSKANTLKDEKKRDEYLYVANQLEEIRDVLIVNMHKNKE